MISSQQLAERIVDARERRKLTQAAVAEQLGLSRQTYLNVEKGVRRPADDELVRLAELLGVSVHELLRATYVRARVSPRFRAAARALGSPGLDEATSRLRTLAQRYVELERMQGLERKPAPLELLRSYRADAPGASARPPRLLGEQAEQKVRDWFGLGDEPLLTLDERLESEAGMRIFYLDRLPSTLSGFLLYADDIGPCVAINANHPVERQRLTICHELGHLLYDPEQGDICESTGPSNTPSELFADGVMIHLLLPRAGVRRVFFERAELGVFTPLDIVWMARLFGVSFEAMARQLEELDLLKKGTFDRLKRSNIKPSQLARQEGMPAQIGTRARKFPDRYVRLAVAAYERDVLSESEFAEVLEMDLVDARDEYDRRKHVRLEDGSILDVDDRAPDLRS